MSDAEQTRKGGLMRRCRITKHLSRSGLRAVRQPLWRTLITRNLSNRRQLTPSAKSTNEMTVWLAVTLSTHRCLWDDLRDVGTLSQGRLALWHHGHACDGAWAEAGRKSVAMPLCGPGRVTDLGNTGVFPREESGSTAVQTCRRLSGSPTALTAPSKNSRRS